MNKATFRSIANRISQWAGTSTVFIGAVLVIVIWGTTGPIFGFSDTWQLVINTSTTIVTFLMVFLIQNTQNRDTKAIQLKLDELIYANKAARDTFVGLEDLTDEDLADLDEQFKTMANSPTTVAALAKLHKKIALEHHRRKTGDSNGKAVLNALLIPAEEAIRAVEKLTHKK